MVKALNKTICLGLARIERTCNNLYAYESNCDIKFAPWSVKISLGILTRENMFTIVSPRPEQPQCFGVVEPQSILWNNHITPTYSHTHTYFMVATFSKGSETTGKVINGALASLHPTAFWLLMQLLQYLTTSLNIIGQ